MNCATLFALFFAIHLRSDRLLTSCIVDGPSSIKSHTLTHKKPVRRRERVTVRLAPSYNTELSGFDFIPRIDVSSERKKQ